jgi:hypothetical protein
MTKHHCGVLSASLKCPSSLIGGIHHNAYEVVQVNKTLQGLDSVVRTLTDVTIFVGAVLVIALLVLGYCAAQVRVLRKAAEIVVPGARRESPDSPPLFPGRPREIPPRSPVYRPQQQAAWYEQHADSSYGNPPEVR